MKSVTIIGAGYAGLLAALRLSTQCNVTLINSSDTFVERIRLHQVASGQSTKKRPIANYLRGTHIQFVRATVTAIQPTPKQLWLDSGEILPYETLIYALGSRIDRDSVPGVREYAYTLSPNEAHRLAQVVRPSSHLVVCGGGLTGIEAAAEFAETFKGTRITLLTRGSLGEHLSARGQAYLHRTLERLGVILQEDADIERLTEKEFVTNRGAMTYDYCLWAGSFSVPMLARESGIATNTRGQILVNAALRSISHPDIYAAGDSAYVPGIRMACATALPMGAHVADNILNGDSPFRFGYIIQCISLGRNKGLVQFVHGDDSPRKRILTGRIGAFVKEMICRYTVASLATERRSPGAYRWPHAKLQQKLELAEQPV